MSNPFGDKRAGNGVLSQEQCMENILAVSASKTLKVYERNILITGKNADALVMTLPAAHLCPGAIFCFRMTVASTGTYTVTIKDAGATDVVGDTMTADADTVVVMSLGHGWAVLHDTTT